MGCNGSVNGQDRFDTIIGWLCPLTEWLKRVAKSSNSRKKGGASASSIGFFLFLFDVPQQHTALTHLD
jgi:hypothetical protein